MLLISLREDACDFCGCCVGVCPEDAIELGEASLRIVEQRCTNCAKCVWICPFEALLFHSPKKTVPDIAPGDE
jgi:ferredoxin